MCMLCITPFQLFFAARWVRREKRWNSLTPFLLIAQTATMLMVVVLEASRYDSAPVAMRTIAYACLVTPFLMATVVMNIVCARNFGRGLKPYLERNQVTAGDRSSIDSHKRATDFGKGFEHQELSRPAPARMELD